MKSMKELIYYASQEGRKFVVVKIHPQIVKSTIFKSIESGKFVFAISDELQLKEFMKQAEEKLVDVIQNADDRNKVLDIIYDILAEILIDGIVFELNVEQTLYLANVLARHVDEDYEMMREMRVNAIFEEMFNNKDKDPNIC